MIFSKNIKKVFASSLLSVFSAALLLTPSAALAKDVKVYLTEGIGAGVEVNHVTRCSKSPRLVPLRCNKDNASSFPKQCLQELSAEEQEKAREENKPTDPKVLVNKYIKICHSDAAGMTRDERKRTVEDSNYDLTACPAVADQDFIVETVWAVYKCADRSDECIGGEGSGDSKQKVGDDYHFKDRIVLETIASSGQPSEDTKPPGSTKTLAEKYSDIEWDFAPLYEIGKPENAEVSANVCDEADYYVRDGTDEASGRTYTAKQAVPDTAKQAVPGSGTLAATYSTMPLPECATYNGSFTGDGRPTWTCTTGEMITGASGTGLLSNFIAALYRWAASIVGIAAVLIIVVSGIQISMGGDGSSGVVDEAKKRILQSLIGIAILFLSGLILYIINPTFFVN
ncbi:MAG: pilin [Patescibacteria group bacterium]